MSDDLISRKELLKKFIVSDNGRRIPEYDIDNFPVEIPIKDVKDIIRQLPASFDKEKVIEELKAWEKASYNTGIARAYSGLDNKASEYYQESRAYHRAIEIVEKGGIE